MREFALLRRIYEASTSLGPRVLLPPGDDLGIVRLDGHDLLIGVDQLVAGRHVRLESTPLELVGRKAIARSVSDIAAMAGHPRASLVAVVLPPDFGEDRAAALFEAMQRAAEEFRCPLMGGDIAFHSSQDHPLTVSVTVCAEPHPLGAVTRSGAVEGDDLFVTGGLGGSLESDGGGRHLTFQPRIAEALQLRNDLGDRLRAMIDISDGLGRDASHIAEASKVRIEIDAGRIPCNPGIDWRSAAAGGEDYELLFAASGDVPGRVGTVPVTRIGVVRRSAAEGEPLVLFRSGDEVIPGDELGWEHQRGERDKGTKGQRGKEAR